MLLGRRLLTPLRAVSGNNSDASTASDAAMQRIQLHDRFFCETMESIPPQYYFPTDEEENWLKSQAKSSKKYHRDVMAQNVQESSKNAVKRAKFTPSEHKSNEARQLKAADDDKRLKQTPNQTTKTASPNKKHQTKAKAVAITTDKNPTAASLDGLKARLALKIQMHREQRRADEKSGTKRQATGAANIEPVLSKKRKTGSASASSAFNNNSKTNSNNKPIEQQAVESEQPTSAVAVTTDSISYGSLLLADDKRADDKKATRNGQGIRGIKNLLKKAERNQQRMAELKQTDEGKAVVEAKQWTKAIKQAAGEVVMDDPKLLRNKLKKKEKAKAKSSKEWKQRVATVEISKKEKQKKRIGNIKGGRHAAADAREAAAKEKTKGRKGPRAGFEGKKGESFLNGDKKGKKKQ